jgi:hypothetical protein
MQLCETRHPGHQLGNGHPGATSDNARLRIEAFYADVGIVRRSAPRLSVAEWTDSVLALAPRLVDMSATATTQPFLATRRRCTTETT